ncbi:Antirestriction protein [Rhodopirellula islandica]|uniref:Antirestriction protein n=1 Tax=Rhodopirellula islandica TaxID=595434 RepID=A0A0J1B646_RHOIS|nr:zincin-like metallopeptidase domain-containing protein [Rhodopirellula islandica]KLU02217.1 Antirestriction protein [Rhodopirellula islandica]
MAKKKHGNKPKRDIYREVTDRIIGYLEQGTAPWKNPIRGGTGDGWPKNLESGKRYRGINVLLLGMRSFEAGFSSDYWMTYRQAQAKNGQVKKGEKGSLVTFWKMYATRDKATGEPIEIPMLKHYTAFNVEQIDGIEIPDAPHDLSDAEPFEPIIEAERIVAGYQDKPSIEHDGGNRAFYRPSTDGVHMPKPEKFESPENYYSVLFHELTHSSGHSSRLNRGLDTELAPFGSPDYSREELIAEMGAAFLCAASGISRPTIEQSASYLQSWIDVLKGDSKLVIGAAGAAQKAVDHILGETFQDAANVAPTKNKPVTTESIVAAGTDTNSAQLDLF